MLQFVNLSLLGDESLGSLIDTVDNIDTQIGHLSETKRQLETFLEVVGEY